MEIYTYENLLDQDFVDYLSLIFLYYELVTFKTCDNTLEIRIKLEELMKESALKEALAKFPGKKFMISTKNIERYHYDINDPFVKEFLMITDKKYLEKGK